MESEMKITASEIFVDCPHCGERVPIVLNELDRYSRGIIICYGDDDSEDLNGCNKYFIVVVKVDIKAETFKINGM